MSELYELCTMIRKGTSRMTVLYLHFLASCLLVSITSGVKIEFKLGRLFRFTTNAFPRQPDVMVSYGVLEN